MFALPMSALRKPWLSPLEYLALERVAETRSEYLDGEIFAMAGGTLGHNLIAANSLREIGNAMKDRPCIAVGSDMKVRIEAANTFVYPDVSGLCGPIQIYDDGKDAYSNPSFIIEVLSDSTETYDRGGKFHRYQTLPSLREYILISQTSMAVDVFRRQGAEWLYHSLQQPGDLLRIDSVGCVIPLAEIYRGVEFDE
jgi:Uma2 family endonuclease